jgi:hypothetical protein
MSELNKTFTAMLEREPEKGGWTYVVLPDSATFFGTRGSSRSEALSMVAASRAPSWRSGTVGTSCPSRRI